MRKPDCLAVILMLLGACAPTPRQEPIAAEAPPAKAPANEPYRPQAQRNGAPDPKLPIVGDPLGLLSKPRANGAPDAAVIQVRNAPRAFDPGALMASGQVEPTRVERERDPRAIARVQAELARSQKPRVVSNTVSVIEEKSAREVLGAIQNGAARPHVLFLYASYCGACRSVMPAFVDLARTFKQRGVLFTAASVDEDRDAFAQYAPVLGGALPAVWIRPEGTTRDELKRLGLKLEANGYSIPLFALFDQRRRLIAEGHARELHNLPRALDELL